MPTLKKIIPLLFFLISFLALSSSLLKKPTFAQAVIDEQEWRNVNQGDGYPLEKSALTNNAYTLYTLNEFVLGSEPNAEGKTLIPGGGAVSQVNSLIAQMITNPPVSTSEYLADLGSSLGLSVKPAHAQGIGWKALKPVLKVWKAFRNIAYMAFIIIFIVIGFMIMFRAKINPQTVITLQTALPKIIITLLLVTFSYAIAGLMIDLIYIGIYLIVGILRLGGVLTESQPALDLLFSKNPFSLVFEKGKEDIFIRGPGVAIQEIIKGFVGTWGEDTSGFNLVGGLAKLVIGIAVLFKLFQLFFSLLLSYMGIVISVIFAPFNILFNAFPGSNSFVGWLKNLFSNVIVFPVVAGMFLLAAVLIGPEGQADCGQEGNPWCVAGDIGYFPQAEDPGTHGEVWVPPFLSIEKYGDAGAGSTNTFQALIALGIIMMTPTIVTQVKKMLKVEPSGFGGAVVGGIMAGPSALGGFAQQAYGMYQQRMSVQAMKDQTKAVQQRSTVRGESLTQKPKQQG